MKLYLRGGVADGTDKAEIDRRVAKDLQSRIASLLGMRRLTSLFTRQPQVSNITQMSQKSLNCNASAIFTMLILCVIKSHPNNSFCLDLRYPIVKRANKQEQKRIEGLTRAFEKELAVNESEPPT